MKEFEYAAPRTEEQVLDLLSPVSGQTEILAGGTDLIGLMKKMIHTPERVVNIKEVSSLKSITSDSTGLTLGAAVTLDELLDSPALDAFASLKQAIRGISSQQLQCQGTLGGELCQRPRCWYFRNGYGLLAQSGKLVEQGENQFHAIFGNSGPAKFVCASRLAPALIALNAQVRVVAPALNGKPGMREMFVPLADLYRIPRADKQRELNLESNQLLAHIHIPAAGLSNATYEVRQGAGPDYPLAAAAAALKLQDGVVVEARIVLGQVAPTPWVSREAAQALMGRRVDELVADDAGAAAVSQATPLSQNHYKVQLARTAVKRAVLLAAGLETGGL